MGLKIMMTGFVLLTLSLIAIKGCDTTWRGSWDQISVAAGVILSIASIAVGALIIIWSLP
jgi:hypothetical protein